jgi:hypothetical protein
MKRTLCAVALILAFPCAVLAEGYAANPVGDAVAGFLHAVVFPVLSALLLGLVGVVLNKVRQEYNLNISEAQQQWLEGLARQGISLAEEYAAAMVKERMIKITGKEKLDRAVGHVLSAAPTVPPEVAERLVHSMLGRIPGAGATGRSAFN